MLEPARNLQSFDYTTALGVEVMSAHLLTHEHKVPVNDLDLALVLIRVGLRSVAREIMLNCIYTSHNLSCNDDARYKRQGGGGSLSEVNVWY